VEPPRPALVLTGILEYKSILSRFGWRLGWLGGWLWLLDFLANESQTAQGSLAAQQSQTAERSAAHKPHGKLGTEH